ncbi:TIGR03364 family FAD-dependent oxidoreductase [Singulisphaera sp. PoT]|uniref:TIGR03364 family FAD-dependent oxidoreductase n=1 Tax=Singulisphaera sp. PoT TaxID=3411797 RepID=UPI003BF49E6E
MAVTRRFDDAVVGAGIVGLAHAYHLARRGRKVLVFERGPRASGASVRNFGMLWPIGQAPGPIRDLAVRSVEVWRGVLAESGLWHAPVGSLHLAYHEDEEQVLREFVAKAKASGIECDLLAPGEVVKRAPGVRPEGLRVGMWSPTEVSVDPRQIVAGLPEYLSREFGVTFRFGTVVTDYDHPTITAGGETWSADKIWVCSGDDYETLYPEAFGEHQLVRCKLQMMRSAPIEGGWRLGPMLAAGLTLRHYRAFEDCPTLPELKARVARENPEFDRFGIHVMASQNGLGEVVVGDSHEYGDDIEPFDKAMIDEIILRYLMTFLAVPGFRIASRWNGIYAKHPNIPYMVANPGEGATAVTVSSGLGMTLSFGLAEQVVSNALGSV